MPVIAQLYVYPIKGCRGVSAAAWPLGPYGFRHDREFLVVDENNRFLTQRDTPRLALITPSFLGLGLVLKAPGVPEIELPCFGPEADSNAGSGINRRVVIWRDEVNAEDQGDAVSCWLSEFLQRPGRLVRIGGKYHRPIHLKPGSAGPLADHLPEVSFADGFPYLVLSTESLRGLNARLDEPLGLERFRPNLVVTGCAQPHEEDRWKIIQIGPHQFQERGPCGRCIVTTTDQDTLERGREPLRTLAKYRKGPAGEVIFGMNYSSNSLTGQIAVGDEVSVLEEKDSAEKSSEI